MWLTWQVYLLYYPIQNTNVICCSCRLGNDTWILDSGASDHMSYDANILHDLKMLETPISISFCNDHKVQVTHNGKLRLNNWIELHHVLLIPYFKYNLLSVKQLTRQLQCDVIF